MMHNKRIADIFDEIADMLELEPGDHRFEVRAYRRAAINISSMQEDVEDLLNKKGMEGLREIPGIGEGLAQKIADFVRSGKIKKYEELKKKYPIDFTGMMGIQGLGPKKIFRLYKELGIRNMEDLKDAILSHRISGLPGFGRKSEEVIGKGIKMGEASKGRMLLGEALPEAEQIAKKIMESGLVDKAEVAGSARRMKETVGDIDILVVSSMAGKVMDFASKLEEVSGTISKGNAKSTFMLNIGITCDIRAVGRKSFGSAMQYFTGSKDHGVICRQIAIKKGLKLSEYGLFDKKGKAVAGSEESRVYERLGMDYIEPEMRENRGEIDAALAHNLPKLVKLGEIKGDLHIHTDHTDGSESIADMAKYAMSKGYEYIGISDHTKSEYVANGMDDKRFMKYFNEIDKAQKALDGIKILKSGEIDILKDGSLDLEKKTMERMDYRLCTVHMNRNMDKMQMTARIVRAMESGYMDIWAHPTGRLINQREALQLDMDKLFQAAKDNGIIMEINSYPNRLDLNDENIMKAREYGLRFAVNTDAHRAAHMDLMRYGIGMARRGWLEKKSVINALDYASLKKSLKKA